MDTRDRLAYVPLDHDLAAQLLAHVPEDHRADHWHLVTPDGRDLVGGVAGIALFEELRPPLRWLGRGLRALRLAWAARIGDEVLARLRPRLGRFVRDEPGPMRYP